MKFSVGPAKGETLEKISVACFSHAAVDCRAVYRRLGGSPLEMEDLYVALWAAAWWGGHMIHPRSTWTYHVSPLGGVKPLPEM